MARVYHAKLIDFHDFVIKKGFFLERLQPGHTSLSFRREVYHMNIFLLIMENGSKLSGPDDFDKYISAEFPDEKKYPELHRLVCKHMIHRPCGVLNKNCRCMVDGACRFK